MAAVNEALQYSIEVQAATAINQLRSLSAGFINLASAMTQVRRAMAGKTFKGLVTEATRAAEATARVTVANNKAAISFAKLTQEELKSARAAAQVTTAQNKINNSAKGSISSMVKWGAAIGGVYTAVRELTKGFEFTATIEQATASFTVMTGSAETAGKMIGQLADLQQRSMMGMSEGAEGVKQMMAYGFAAKDAVKQMEMLARVGSAVNVSVGDMAYVYGTLRSQGRAYTRDLMQFAMRGIPIYEALAKTMGVSGSQIKKLTEDGKIGFAEVEAAMRSMVSNGGIFFGLMEKQMDTLGGKFNILGKEWQIGMGKVIESASPALKKFADAIIGVLRANPKMFTDLGNAIGSIVTRITPLVAKLLPELVSAFTTMAQVGATVVSVFTPIVDVLLNIVSVINGPLTTALLTLAAGAWASTIVNKFNLIGTMATAAAGVNAAMGTGGVASALTTGGAASLGAAATSVGSLGVLVPPIAALTVVIGGLKAAIDSNTETLRQQSLVGGAGGDKAIEGLLTQAAASGMGGFLGDLQGGLATLFKMPLSSWTAGIEKLGGSFRFAQKQADALKLPFDKIVSVMQQAGVISEEAAARMLVFNANYKRLFTDVLSRMSPANAPLPNYDALNANITNLKGNSLDTILKRLESIFGVIAQSRSGRTATSVPTTNARGVVTSSNVNTDVSGAATAAALINGLGNAIIPISQIQNELTGMIGTWQANGKSAEEIASLTDTTWKQLAGAYNQQIAAALENAQQIQTSPVWNTLTSNEQSQINSFVAVLTAATADVDKYSQAHKNAEKQIKALGTWWTPLEIAVASTATEVDDLQLSYRKQVESLQNEYAEREKNIRELKLGSTETAAALAALKTEFDNASTTLAQYNAALISIKKTVESQELASSSRSLSAAMQGGRATPMAAINTEYQNGLMSNVESIELLRKKYSSSIITLAEFQQGLADVILKGRELGNAFESAKAQLYDAAASTYQSTDLMAPFIAQLGEALVNRSTLQASGTATQTQIQSANIEVASANIKTMAAQAVQGTDTGNLIASIKSGQSIWEIIIGILLKVLATSSTIQKLLDFVQIFVENFGVVFTTIDLALGPLIEMIGIVAKAIAPIINIAIMIADIMSASLYPVIAVIVAIISVLGAVFTWLSDTVIVPMGNAFIDLVNGVIISINEAITWLNTKLGFTIEMIPLMERLLTSTEAAIKKANIATALEAVTDTITYLNDKMKKEIDKMITNAQDLYEVGAISATEYQNRVNAANAFDPENDTSNVLQAALDATTLMEMSAMISALEVMKKDLEAGNATYADLTVINGYLKDISAAVVNMPNTLAGLSAATSYFKNISTLPEDITGAITAGFVTVADTWENSLGDLISSLTTGTATGKDNDIFGQTGGTTGYAPGGAPTLPTRNTSSNSYATVINLYVEGSVQTENDLTKAIANRLYKMRTSGAITT